MRLRRTLLPMLLFPGVVLAQGTSLQGVPLRSGTPRPSRDGAPADVHFRRVPEGERREAPELDVKVGRMWVEGAMTYASVQVRNTSPYELDEILVNCSALAADGRELSVQEEKVRASAAAPIGPGFSTNVRLTLDRRGTDVRELSCNARGY